MVLTYSKYNVLKKGDKAPEFKLKGTDGKEYSLEGFKGKNLLIVFMCNHCPYVQPKFDYLNELQEKYKKFLQVIGINTNSAAVEEDSFENMKEYAETGNFKFLYLDDNTQKVARSFGAECTPDPFLFDSEHKLVYHGRFDDAHMYEHKEGNTAEIEEALQQLIEGKKVLVKEEPSCGCNVKWK
ncbi:thioredoxin family protein [Candidatus Micrarchaeota archaeon]|nr:thioredoxin family protein [Candidatus Micrarchaeota archaeon]MBU2476200.1 thioredoxin family protein [Candidatus Micrarchaeota archaeon]